MAKEPAAAKPAAETVIALTPIVHDGATYGVGASITMTPEQAAALYEMKAAEPAAPAAPAA